MFDYLLNNFAPVMQTSLITSAAILWFWALANIFRKAGLSGWFAFAPFVRLALLMRMVRWPWPVMLTLLVPGLNIIIVLPLFYELGRTFGKSRWFSLGMAFMPFVFVPALGLSNAKYIETPREMRREEHPAVPVEQWA